MTQMVSDAPTAESATPTIAPSAVDAPRFVGIVHSECDEHTLEDRAKRFLHPPEGRAVHHAFPLVEHRISNVDS